MLPSWNLFLLERDMDMFDTEHCGAITSITGYCSNASALYVRKIWFKNVQVKQRQQRTPYRTYKEMFKWQILDTVVYRFRLRVSSKAIWSKNNYPMRNCGFWESIRAFLGYLKWVSSNIMRLGYATWIQSFSIIMVRSQRTVCTYLYSNL